MLTIDQFAKDVDQYLKAEKYVAQCRPGHPALANLRGHLAKTWRAVRQDLAEYRHERPSSSSVHRAS